VLGTNIASLWNKRDKGEAGAELGTSHLANPEEKTPDLEAEPAEKLRKTYFGPMARRCQMPSIE